MSQEKHPLSAAHYDDLRGRRGGQGRGRDPGVLSAAGSQFSSNWLSSLQVIFAHLSSLLHMAWAPALSQFSRMSFLGESEPLLPSICAEGAAFLVFPSQWPWGAQPSVSGGCDRRGCMSLAKCTEVHSGRVSGRQRLVSWLRAQACEPTGPHLLSVHMSTSSGPLPPPTCTHDADGMSPLQAALT